MGENLRVLVVDDNLINQKVAVKILEKIGCTVVAAASGREAIILLTEQPCDLIFMDCQMPELDGYQTTQMIRVSEDSRINNIPIIALTANTEHGDEERCRAAGMNDYLAKPIRLHSILETINKWEAIRASN